MTDSQRCEIREIDGSRAYRWIKTLISFRDKVMRTMINSTQEYLLRARERTRGQGTFSSYHFISTRSRSRVVCINKQSSETGNVRLGEKERGGEKKRESGARYPYSIEATIFTRFFLIKLPAAAALLSAAIIRHGTGYEQYSGLSPLLFAIDGRNARTRCHSCRVKRTV